MRFAFDPALVRYGIRENTGAQSLVMKNSNSLSRAVLGIMGVWLIQGSPAVHADEAVTGTPPSSISQPATFAPASQPEGIAPAPEGTAQAPEGAAQTPEGMTQAPEGVAQPDAGTAQGDVAKLTQLIHDPQLAELRTTYNGSYGASLYFYAPEMTWYVALLQNRQFWRVIRSQDEANAELIYTQFVRQTVQLAKAEFRVTRLKAQQALIERMIALSNARARRLQADLAVAQAQQAEVDSRQLGLRSQTTSLQTEKRRARAQLRNSENQVRSLQRAMEASVPTTRAPKAR